MVKILIVEDDSSISQLYHRIFSIEGYTVELAANGEEGMLKVNSFRPTLILLDINMPTMNGMQVLDALKSNPQTQMIPVIVLTNLSGEQYAQAALAKGVLKYLTKSDYEPVQIASIVKQALADLANPKPASKSP